MYLLKNELDDCDDFVLLTSFLIMLKKFVKSMFNKFNASAAKLIAVGSSLISFGIPKKKI